MIKRKSIDDVIDRAQVEEVVEDFVTLKNRGANLLGLCPFHNEKTPSFTVSPSKNIYKCFGCGKGGHPVSFVMEHENYSFPEAIRYLAKKYNIEIEEDEQTQEDLESAHEKGSLFIINDFAKNFFHQQLLNTDEGKSVGLGYFRERGLLLSTITDFQLGYSPAEAKALINLAESQGFKQEFLSKLGLRSKSGLDFFRSRIIFPITNMSGKVIAFGGRTLSTDKKIPKYLNSAESEIYIKSNSLYGLFQAKNAIRKNNNCYLVEGYTDVLSLHQNKIQNVVASSGTSLTEGQLRVIKRFSSTITFLYDGDSAGQKAARRGLSLALDQDFDVKIVPLAEDQDPDSLIQSIGADSFSTMLEEKTQDFIVYQAKSLMVKYANHPIEKSQAIRDLLEQVAHIYESLKRSIYIKELCSILEIDENSAYAELNKHIRKNLASKRKKDQQIHVGKGQPDPVTTLSKAEKQTKFRRNDYYQEKELVRILLNDGGKFIDEENKFTVADSIIENLRDVFDLFEFPKFKKIIEDYSKNQDRIFESKMKYFLDHPDQEIKEIVVELVQERHEYANWTGQGVELQTQKVKDENFVVDSKQAILRFKLRKLSAKESIIDQKLKNKTLKDEERKTLILTKQKVMTMRRTITDQLGIIVMT